MRIGIFGGSFNPVHKEHVNIAIKAKSELGLDKLFIMPTFMPPHKSALNVAVSDRLNMLKLAFADFKGVEVSDYEISNEGTSYSFITAEHFKSEYPNAEIFMIIGEDMLVDFKTWKYPERILNAVSLAVFRREDTKSDIEKERKYFNDTFKKDFTLLNYVGKICSSTEIRLYVSLGLKIEKFVDKKVADYIKENGLYLGGKCENYLISHLTEKRLVHTVNVVLKGLEKVKELNLEKEKVYTACLLHDCAKYTNYKTVKGFKLESDIPEPVVHSFLGAFVAESILGIKDEEVLDAIKYHTSGKANMSTLSKLVFVADMIEKGRIYEGVERLREVYNVGLEECFKECLKEEVEHLKNKNIKIYKETLNAYEYYIKDNE